MVARPIKLERPCTGTQIMAAVKTVANERREVDPECGLNLAKFHSVHDWADGDVYQIGQVSGYPYEHIRVTGVNEADVEEDCIRLETTYTKLVVNSYGWPAEIYSVGYNHSAVISAVRVFTEKLEHELSDAKEPSVWPQEVQICR